MNGEEKKKKKNAADNLRPPISGERKRNRKDSQVPRRDRIAQNLIVGKAPITSFCEVVEHCCRVCQRNVRSNAMMLSALESLYSLSQNMPEDLD